MGAIDAAALRPVKKQAHGHGRENEKSLLHFACDFSGWHTFSKLVRIVATRRHILKLNAPNSISLSLERSPSALSWT